MKRIHLLFSIFLILISISNSLDESERIALNDLSVTWNLGWDDTLDCPGNRNKDIEYIKCSADGHVVELYIYNLNNPNTINLISYFIYKDCFLKPRLKEQSQIIFIYYHI